MTPFQSSHLRDAGHRALNSINSCHAGARGVYRGHRAGHDAPDEEMRTYILYGRHIPVYACVGLGGRHSNVRCSRLSIVEQQLVPTEIRGLASSCSVPLRVVSSRLAAATPVITKTEVHVCMCNLSVC